MHSKHINISRSKETCIFKQAADQAFTPNNRHALKYPSEHSNIKTSKYAQKYSNYAMTVMFPA